LCQGTSDASFSRVRLRNTIALISSRVYSTSGKYLNEEGREAAGGGPADTAPSIEAADSHKRYAAQDRFEKLCGRAEHSRTPPRTDLEIDSTKEAMDENN